MDPIEQLRLVLLNLENVLHGLHLTTVDRLQCQDAMRRATAQVGEIMGATVPDPAKPVEPGDSDQ